MDRPASTNRELLRIWPDVGAILDVSRTTAFDLVRSGELPVVRVGKRIRRVRRDDLMKFIESRRDVGSWVRASRIEQGLPADRMTASETARVLTALIGPSGVRLPESR